MSDELNYCECEYCPGHHDAGPMPDISCKDCEEQIPTGPKCKTYYSYGWDADKEQMIFKCGKCYKNEQAREARAKKKAKKA